ncbi:hypothetical protein M9H77_13340 [Catharanthus roseus]|uniref:Uncharacterized protein n=1 Tax=Catharanthus roseus TaxID=4058 RepID=A0ACC0BJX2_CATRO|nr:hypothetical protein M9H77_13340 [Catharanthus roseus]
MLLYTFPKLFYYLIYGSFPAALSFAAFVLWILDLQIHFEAISNDEGKWFVHQSSVNQLNQGLLPANKQEERTCCRLSVSSSEEAESSNSDRYPTISSLAHAMVQERLDQMIRERQEIRNDERRRTRGEQAKFIVMVAMEKSSYDPRKDFRESIEQMIKTNRIYEPRDLRRLLNYYVSMNSEEHQGVILEVFHEEHHLFSCIQTTTYKTTISIQYSQSQMQLLIVMETPHNLCKLLTLYYS